MPAAAALCRWSLEVWKAASQGDSRAFSLSQLNSHWRTSLAGKQGSWRAARGPMAVARLEAARIGWQFTSPFELLDASGHRVSLVEMAPKMVQNLAVSSHHVRLEMRAAASLGAAHLPPGRVVVDPIIRISKAKGWTARQAGTIRAAAVGSVWTASRQLAAGYMVSGICSLCELADDTPCHRLYGCECDEARACREQFAPPDFVARALAAGPGSLMYERGLLTHPGWPPPTEEVATAFLVDGEQAELPGSMEGDLFVDGACYPHVVPDLARAGWAVVQHNPAGPRRAIYGRVWPPLPQTSQAAEWVAWAVAHQVASGPSRIFPDCLNVTRAHAKPLEAKLRHIFPFAGVVRSTLNDSSSRHIKGCVKAKAHFSLFDNMSYEFRQHTIAKKRADHFAKLGAKQHPGPSDEQSAGWLQGLESLGHFASLVTKNWQLWPKLPKAERPVLAPGVMPRRRVRGPTGPNAVKHAWTFGMGRWQCTPCAKTCMDDKSKGLFENRSCPSGGIPLPTRLARGASGHNLKIASCQGLVFVFCSTCGRWATMRFSGLFSPCCGSQSAAGQFAFARIARGEHPTLSVPDGPAHKVGDGGVVVHPVMRPAQIRVAALLARVRAKQ